MNPVSCLSSEGHFFVSQQRNGQKKMRRAPTPLRPAPCLRFEACTVSASKRRSRCGARRSLPLHPPGARTPRVCVCCLLFLFTACSSVSSSPNSMPVVSSSSVSAGEEVEFRKTDVRLVDPNGESVTVNVEVAENDAQRARGLMFRDHLNADAGMLFIFEQPQQLSFWMKNTLIPLDILFFDAEGKFISSAMMKPCTEDPCPGYPSGGMAKYALEVNGGFVEKNAIGTEWRMISY